MQYEGKLFHHVAAPVHTNPAKSQPVRDSTAGNHFDLGGIAWGYFSNLFSALIHPAAIVAGVVCTGLTYVMMTLALRLDPRRPFLPGSWATQLYGFDPITVMAVAVLVMGEPLPNATTSPDSPRTRRAAQ